jgi:hypothetical protein
VKKRLLSLMDSYVKDTKLEWVTDEAFIEGTNLGDPFYAAVLGKDESKVPLRISVQGAVDGYYDFPNPGGVLCASLALCFKSSLRMIIN